VPTYEYECEESGKRFELFQNMKDEPVKTCPKCGGPAHRLISAGAALLLKRTASGNLTRCGSDRPCCGRDVPCDSPPCSD